MNEVDGSRAINYRRGKKTEDRRREGAKGGKEGGIMRPRKREERERERDEQTTEQKIEKLAASGGKLSGTAVAWLATQFSQSVVEFNFDSMDGSPSCLCYWRRLKAATNIFPSPIL